MERLNTHPTKKCKYSKYFSSTLRVEEKAFPSCLQPENKLRG